MGKKTMKFALIGLLLVFAILPGLIIGTVGTFSLSNYSHDVNLEQLKTVSLSKSSAIDTLLSGYVADVSTLSKLSSVVSTVQQNNDAALNQLKAFSDSSGDIIDILIIDNKGTVLTSTADLEKDAFEHFDENGMPMVSGLLSWEKYKTDAIYISMPIFADPEKREGGKLGYVVMVLAADNPEAGIGKIITGDYLNGKAHLFLVDTEGNAVNFDGIGSLMKSGQVDSAIVNEVTNIFDNTQGINGSNDEKSMQIQKMGRYTTVYGFIPNISSWRWVGITDNSTLTEFSSKNIVICWVVLAIAVVLSCIAAFIVVGKFVGNMHSMLEKMQNINSEDGSASTFRFDVKHDKSELGSIQNSFNEFMDEVSMNGQRYRTLANLSDNMLFEWDFHKESMYVSENVLEKFDLDTRKATLLNGRFLDTLMSPEDKEKYKRDINKLLKDRETLNSEYQLRAKNGSNIWVSLSAGCISDRLNEPLRVIGVMTDIDNEKKMELQLSEKASYDFLSQLYNRSTFIRMLSSELDRRGPKKIGMMFIDVDDFKFINDRFGHTVGDEVIRFVANTIRMKVEEKGGFAGRFGGDEFVLCFTDQNDIANIEQIALDIIDELYVGYSTSEGTLINVRSSIGISICPDHTENVDELISCADTAMYFVKKNGKTNYHIYVSDDNDSNEYMEPEGY